VPEPKLWVVLHPTADPWMTILHFVIRYARDEWRPYWAPHDLPPPVSWGDLYEGRLDKILGWSDDIVVGYLIDMALENPSFEGREDSLRLCIPWEWIEGGDGPDACFCRAILEQKPDWPKELVISYSDCSDAMFDRMSAIYGSGRHPSSHVSP